MSAPAPRAPSFLGTGWSFPPRFSRGGAELATVSDTEAVHQAIQLLLATRRAERAMEEEYGCNLDAALFEELDQRLVNRIRASIHDAVLAHEPRIKLLAIDVSPTEEVGLLRIELSYAILETNSRYNMVLPFHVNEAVAPR